MDEKIVLYTYNDKYGQGINPKHLITYSSSIIFDKENRTLYANGSIVGHRYFTPDFNSYHGEIFNDYNNNEAIGDYSSAFGSGNSAKAKYSTATGLGNVSTAKGSFSTGTYNMPTSYSLFTVGNGSGYEDRSNAFDVRKNGDVILSGKLISGDTDLISYLYNSYNYIRELSSYSASDADVKLKDISDKVSHVDSKVDANTEAITYLVQIDDQMSSDIEELQTSYTNLSQYTIQLENKLSDLRSEFNNLKSSYDVLYSYTYSEIAEVRSLLTMFNSSDGHLVITQGV